MCSKYIDAIEFLKCSLPAQPKPVCALNRLSPFYGAIDWSCSCRPNIPIGWRLRLANKLLSIEIVEVIIIIIFLFIIF